MRLQYPTINAPISCKPTSPGATNAAREDKFSFLSLRKHSHLLAEGDEARGGNQYHHHNSFDPFLPAGNVGLSHYRGNEMNTESHRAGSGNLNDCRYCKGISLQALSAPGGYKHASNRASLVRSAQKCRLCSLLFRRDRTRHSSALYLALEQFSDEDPQICLRVSYGDEDSRQKSDLAFFMFTSRGN